MSAVQFDPGSGSPALWQIAEAVGAVPAPPDRIVAGRLAAWLALPIRYGCASAAAGAELTVVAPDPAVWCPDCAQDRLAAERRCWYCRRPVRLGRGSVLLHELGAVRIVGRCHPTCARKASR